MALMGTEIETGNVKISDGDMKISFDIVLKRIDGITMISMEEKDE